MNIIPTRLANQHLIGKKFTSAQDVVKHLGAVQAQDISAAKWGLGLRVENATDITIEEAFNKGRILRTHVMRPTWHFVLPEDVYWMQQHTSTQVKKLMGHYNKKLELDDAVFQKTNTTIVSALREYTYLTRQELKKELEAINITTDVQRLAHIIMWAELDALIVSGPRRGKQFTYALLETRAPQQKQLTRDEAFANLALRYFTSHGPAQLKDFSWWSGLSVKDATFALDLVSSKLHTEKYNEKIYWYPPNTLSSPQPPKALLVSIFDEYTIAYTDRSDLSDPAYIEKLLSMGNALTAVMLLYGKVIGTWKRVIKPRRAEITLNPFRTLTPNEKDLFEQEVHHYGTFLNSPISFSISSPS